MSGRKQYIPQDKMQAICDDLRAGMPVRAISEKHGIGGKLLMRIQKENGLLRGAANKKRNDDELQTDLKVLEDELAKDDEFRKAFPGRWDEATRPIRNMIWRRERKRGVYW